MHQLAAVVLFALSVVSSTTTSVTFSGNSTTTAFATGFKFLSSANLVVTKTTSGVTTTLTLGVDYTVTGADSDSGGTVTCTSAPATGSTLKITRVTPVTQTVALQHQGPLPVASIQDAFDKGIMVSQEANSASTSLTTRVGTLETEVYQLDAGINALSSHVGTIDGEIATLQSTDTTQNVRLDTAESSISTLLTASGFDILAIYGAPHTWTKTQTFTTSTSNTNAVVGTGKGNGAGGYFTGGLTSGTGVAGIGGGTSGSTGVYGEGTAYGVYAQGDFPNGVGVLGNGYGGGAGGQFNGGATDGNGVSAGGQGAGAGISASGGSSAGPGVVGFGGTNGTGVAGRGDGSGTGVDGAGGNSDGIGVLGTGGTGTTGGIGVKGIGGAHSGAGGYGVYGAGGSTAGVGVYGTGAGGGGQFVGAAPNGNGATGSGTGFGVGVSGTGSTSGSPGVYGAGNAGGSGGVGGQFAHGGGTNDAIEADGDISVAGSNPASTTAKTNRITPANTIKAWANITRGASPAVNGGFNVSGATCATNQITVTFASGALADANYYASAISVNASATMWIAQQTTTTVKIAALDDAGGAINLCSGTDKVNVMVVGLQ